MRWTRYLAVLSLLVVPRFGFAGEEHVDVRIDKDAVEFFVGKQLVTRLHIAPSFAKPIFWPMHAPNGASLTRSWPMVKDIPGESTDHPHQKSAWWCHGDIIPEGLELKSRIKGVEGVDFWSEAKGHGVQVVIGRPSILMQKRGKTVVLNIEWRTAEGQKILDERRTIEFHDLSPGRAWLIVIRSNLFASVCTVVFGDTKEGSFGVRVNDQIRADKMGKGKITNAEGSVAEQVTEAKNGCWGVVSDWCDYSGPIDGKVAGLAIFAHPENPYPTAWHSRAYGLMAANPFGRAKSFPSMKGKNDLVKIEKGDRLEFCYGMLLHDGDADSGKVAARYQRFAARRGKE